MSELQPWERQKGEPRRAFHAFCHWRDLAPHERSGAKAYTQHRQQCADPNSPQAVPGDRTWTTPPPSWKTWRREWNWEARSDAHDADVAAQDRQKRIGDIAKMNERHAAIASAVQGKVIERLNGVIPSDLSLGQLIVWLREATVIERRARGEATSIVRHEEEQAGDLSRFSEEELEQYEKLTAKALGREG